MIRKPRKIGRPCKLTPEVQERICAAIADMVPFKFAALGAGVSYEAFEDWKLRGEDPEEEKRFQQFRLAVEVAEATAIQKRLQAISKAGKLPQHWMAHAWTLERRYPGDFGRKDELRNTGNTGNTPQTIINVVLRSPEELAQLERELRLLDQQQRLLPPGQVQGQEQ